MIGWRLTDLVEPGPSAPRVLSTFSCGGGSSMGYKLAGAKVIGAVDIDPQMMQVYTDNLDSGTHVVAGIRDILDRPDLIEQWRGVDILDGSPPCTLFSTAKPNREEYWGKAKRFREGQAVQVLDRLFYDFMDVVEALRPRVFIAENVQGMLIGASKGYVRAVVRLGREHGYDVQVFLLRASDYGVPQLRRRVFFIGRRRDQELDPLTPPPPTVTEVVTPRQAFADLDQEIDPDLWLAPRSQQLHDQWRAGGGSRYYKAVQGRNAGFGSLVIHPDAVSGNTITSGGKHAHWAEPRNLTAAEYLRMGTFPDDYRVDPRLAKYVVGMSVPPRLMHGVASHVLGSWFDG